MKYLILGCGPAGIAAAKAIRGKDKKGEIVMATEEQGPPYLRPLLTDLIMGRVDVAGIADPQAMDLDAQGINVHHGKRAERVDPAGNRVIFADGGEEAYDVLLVATGGKPVIPPLVAEGASGDPSVRLPPGHPADFRSGPAVRDGRGLRTGIPGDRREQRAPEAGERCGLVPARPAPDRLPHLGRA